MRNRCAVVDFRESQVRFAHIALFRVLPVRLWAITSRNVYCSCTFAMRLFSVPSPKIQNGSSCVLP